MSTFGPPAEPFVMVRVELTGTSDDVDESEIGFPARDVRPAEVEAAP